MSVGTKVNPKLDCFGFFFLRYSAWIRLLWGELENIWHKNKQYESLRFMSTPNCRITTVLNNTCSYRFRNSCSSGFAVYLTHCIFNHYLSRIFRWKIPLPFLSLWSRIYIQSDPHYSMHVSNVAWRTTSCTFQSLKWTDSKLSSAA